MSGRGESSSSHAWLRGVFWLGLACWAWLTGSGCTGSYGFSYAHEAPGFQNFMSPQSNPIAVSADGSLVYVVLTTQNEMRILNASNLSLVRAVKVGLEPSGLAVRPGGLEVWVTNHVSDSVSVVDVDPASATYGQVKRTIQTLDANGATTFDEPVGVAFREDGARAFVTLSSRNQVAVIDANTYQVTALLSITAQEPRAITVRNGKVYVAAFESNNRSGLSACLNGDGLNNSQCSLGLAELIAFATEPNLPGQVKNIVFDSSDPDRDVFVFDATTLALVSTAQSVGTLLYGLAVDSTGRVFVAQTDARNLVNGPHFHLTTGQPSVLGDMHGHMFENQIAVVTCPGASCSSTRSLLEPAVVAQPGGGFTGGTTHANSLATPFGVALSADASTLLVTSAGASRLASLNTGTMARIDTVDVGAIPQGVAFHSPAGAAGSAYVLNTVDSTVSKVDVNAAGDLTLLQTTAVGVDPTPAAVRNGRKAFSSAFASTTGNHSCASCHPDGNTDQLLWRIGGACQLAGCDGGDEPRTTMPVRGLENTLPLHWDGTLGDPFGGGNGAVGLAGNGGVDCNPNDADGDHDCFLNLVQGSLGGVMCLQSGTCPNTGLTAQDQDDMATFLASVAYPPARSRRISDVLSTSTSPASLNGTAVSALQGFSDFFVDQGGNAQPHTCADADGGCHALPLGTATNSATLNGFDSPTMRGLTDRFMQFSLGTTNVREILIFANSGLPSNGISPLESAIRWSAATGFREPTTFGAAFTVFEPVYGVRPLDLWQMFEEASTGLSGATGRQVTLNAATAGDAAVVSLLGQLAAADDRGVVNLRGAGQRNNAPTSVSYTGGGNYTFDSGAVLTQAALVSEALAGTTYATFTAYPRSAADSEPQPLLATVGTITTGLIGDPPLPNLSSAATDPAPFTAAGTDVRSAAVVFVDGAPATGATLTCSAGTTGSFCVNGNVSIDLATKPADGLHLLQIQNPSGRLSNELPICVGAASGCD